MSDGTSQGPESKSLGEQHVGASETGKPTGWRGLVHRVSPKLAERLAGRVKSAQSSGESGMTVLAGQEIRDRPKQDPLAALMMEVGNAAHTGQHEYVIPKEQLTPEALAKYGQELKALSERLGELLKARKSDVTYDEFFETAISGYPKDLVRLLLPWYQQQHSDYGPGGYDKATVNVFLDRVTSDIGEQYLPLFIDPGIGMANRPFEFLAFAKDLLEKEPGLNPLELRRRFIASFSTKTYFRGIIVNENESKRELGHLAATVSASGENPDKAVKSSDARIDAILASANRPAENKLHLLAEEGIPMFSRDGYGGGHLRGTAAAHVGAGWTEYSPFLSASEYPEIVYYATSDQGQEEKPWEDWDEHQRLVISRFTMNSYYALDRMSIVSRISGKPYNVGHLQGLTGNSRGVEFLIPFGLPAGHGEDQRVYKPPFNNPDSIPTASNWS